MSRENELLIQVIERYIYHRDYRCVSGNHLIIETAHKMCEIEIWEMWKLTQNKHVKKSNKIKHQRRETMARPKKDDKDKAVRQSVSMDPEQLREVVAYCQINERTIAWVIKKSVDAFLNQQTAGR